MKSNYITMHEYELTETEVIDALKMKGSKIRMIHHSSYDDKITIRTS